MQKSTPKRLQEIPISNAGQAKSVVAQEMLKRSTGTTNTNSQSREPDCSKVISSTYQWLLVCASEYLRDYLEGKKRMALILTVKSGKEDYCDTSYVLRQAAPYMEIKYNNVEEKANISYNKRYFQASSRSEQPKRMKVTSFDASVIEEAKGTGAENTHPEEGLTKSSEDPGICKVAMSD